MPKLQSTDLKATRLGFGEALVELGRENPNVVVLGGDVTGSVRTDLFMKAFPDRFISVGVAEQDMIGTAAGLAVAGKIPFASTYGEFAVGRPFDQIRQSLAYSDLPVKICASHCGITVGPDGATHQSLEDIAIMRVLPHMTVATPCDYHQTKKMIHASMMWKHPIYIRFFRENTPVFTDVSARFEFGKADTLIEGTDVTVIACGLQVWEAILAEEILASEGISVRLLNMHTIKPLDKDAILKAAKETGAIVTAEDHQRHAGLGGAVAEVLAEQYPTPQEFVAVNDTFGESGKGDELMKKYGIAKDDVVKAVKKVLKRKKS
ncbi:MAG: transketolase family protein [Ignavibacteriae bacterium]|nr:transketolase family protein [Ignavibacteria bacterium]MBI3364510.1 transketolase family protein [Ignavibacteriota bacterium]